jgi:hypothetical protein
VRPDREHIRVSDADRDQATTRLREHAAVGRLTMDELAARVEAALAARTQGELDSLFDDLPAQPHREAVSTRAGARRVRGHTAAYVSVSLMMIAIWAATGTGYFWPVWPILGWGIGIASRKRGCGFGPRGLRQQR